MKYLFFFLFLPMTLFSYAESDVIILNPDGQHHDHYDFPAPAVQPEVYYDDVAQEIIIVPSTSPRSPPTSTVSPSPQHGTIPLSVTSKSNENTRFLR